MIPKILEYENNRVRVTASAFAIPEIKDILDRHGNKAEPYLAYVYAMTAPDSAYINIPDEEKEDAIIYDVQMTLGDFDSEDPLLIKAIASLKKKYETPLMRMAAEIGNELERWRKVLQTIPVKMEGKDGNFEARSKIVEKISKYASEYQKVMKMAHEESVATKGDHELGEY